MKALALRLRCPTCTRGLRIRGWTGEERVPCPYGAHVVMLHPPAAERETLDRCPACGQQSLYREKPFPRAAGLSLMGLGIALSFYTYGLSLAAFAALDALLYVLLPWRLACYVCRARIDGAPPTPEQQAFYLHLHERYQHERAARP